MNKKQLAGKCLKIAFIGIVLLLLYAPILLLTVYSFVDTDVIGTSGGGRSSSRRLRQIEAKDSAARGHNEKSYIYYFNRCTIFLSHFLFLDTFYHTMLTLSISNLKKA